MANVNVTYQQMQDAASRLTNGRQEIDSMLAQLNSLIQQLVGDGYVTDRSSKQFEASYQEFNTGAKNVIEGLDGMGKYLQTAAQTFQDADTQLASALGK